MLTQIIGNRVYDFSHTVGRRDLAMVTGVVTGANNTVYLLSRPTEMDPDATWDRIGKMSQIGKYSIGPDWGSEELIKEFGSYGLDDDQFIWPAGITIDKNENIYITDEWLNRVSVFDSNGTILGNWGKQSNRPGGLNRPSGIVSDKDGSVYIVDSSTHRIQKFTNDGSYILGWGEYGKETGQMDSPWGIAIGPDEAIYVADHKNHRVQKFSPTGEFMASFGNYGSDRGHLNRPSDVTLDDDGDIYICDWANNRVQIFDNEGKFITSLLGDAQRLSKWQQQTVDANADVIKARRRVYTLEPEWRFALPTGLHFDKNGSRLIIADTQRARIQIYNKLTDYIEAQYNL